jgi:hypothetical protein
MRARSGGQLIGYGVGGLLLVAAALILYCFDPSRTSVFPPCPFHYLTGCNCPGCGSLRAIHSLLHGNVSTALSMNPLMVVSIPILGVMLLNPRWIYKQWVPWAAMSVLVCYGVLRNLPFWPFSLLAP